MRFDKEKSEKAIRESQDLKDKQKAEYYMEDHTKEWWLSKIDHFLECIEVVKGEKEEVYYMMGNYKLPTFDKFAGNVDRDFKIKTYNRIIAAILRDDLDKGDYICIPCKGEGYIINEKTGKLEKCKKCETNGHLPGYRD